MSSIDLEKFAKYSKAGPRYTSYPTALEFSSEFKYDAYIKYLENSKEKKTTSNIETIFKWCEFIQR